MAATVSTVDEVQDDDKFAKAVATLAAIKHRLYSDHCATGY